MPAPLANLIIAIDAPVSSLRHSIFSEMPFSDFSRHGIFAVSTSISSRFGAPSGRLIIIPPLHRQLLKAGQNECIRLPTIAFGAFDVARKASGRGGGAGIR